MTRICRIARLGQALAVGWACCLAGCQQLHLNSAQKSNRSLINSPADDGKMTAAQQADMQIALGRVTEKQGDLAQAMAAYREALKRDHNCAEAYVRLAILHDKQGEFRESAEMYRKALKLSPGNPDIYCDMGYSLYLQRRWAEADMNSRQAIALDAKHPRAHNNLALLLARDGRLDDALSEFRKGGSDRASAHANVAFVLTMERRWDDARKQYQLALAADPSSTELRARLRQLDTLVAKLEPGEDDVRGKEDARLATTSSTIAQPQRRLAARVAAPRDMPAQITTPKSALSQPEATSSAPLVAISGTVAQPPRRPDAAVAAPRDVPVQITTPKRSISKPEGTSSAALVAIARPKATLGASVGRPGASIGPPRTFEGPKTVERGTGVRPRAPIPPPAEFKAPKTVQPDSKRPETSRSVIPPPRIRVPRPARSRTDEPADIPSLAPLTINVPKADSAAVKPQSAETSPIPPLESAR